MLMSKFRPKVLVVGHGPPTRGGIPSFVTGLIEDQWLADRASIEYFNTCPRSKKLPGALNLSNVWLTVAHAVEVLRRSRRVDIVHLNVAPLGVLPLFRALLMAACAKLSGTAVILHAHAGGLAEIVARSAFYRALMKLSRWVVDEVVVVSRDSEAALGRLRKGVSFIANGVDLQPFGPKGPEDLGGGKPTLLFAGSVCERKGLLDLRDALLRLREDEAQSLPLEVRIAGDDAQEPGGFEQIRSAYDDAGLHDVAFLGALAPPDMMALFREAHLFCLPSHREGLPLSLLEAMAAECGIVASQVGDIPFVLNDGECGILIEPHDVSALATAIQRLVRDIPLRQTLGRRARARVEQEFERTSMVMKLNKIYVGAMGPRSPRGARQEFDVA